MCIRDRISSVQSRISSTLRGTYIVSSAHALRKMSIFGADFAPLEMESDDDSFRFRIWISCSDVNIPHAAKDNDDIVELLS